MDHLRISSRENNNENKVKYQWPVGCVLRISVNFWKYFSSLRSIKFDGALLTFVYLQLQSKLMFVTLLTVLVVTMEIIKLAINGTYEISHIACLNILEQGQRYQNVSNFENKSHEGHLRCQNQSSFNIWKLPRQRSMTHWQRKVLVNYY